MQHWIDTTGGGLAWFLLSAFILAAAIAGGTFAGRRTHKIWLGWIIGLLIFGGLALLFARSLYALGAVSCRGAVDYQACLNGDDL